VHHLAPIHGVRQIPATGFNYKKHIQELKVPIPTERVWAMRAKFSPAYKQDQIL
jgi:2,4-diketo-3-deoxy-L-fuconate hydrolase